MNQQPPKRPVIKNDEDFSSSMARLAELAAKGLAPDKPKDQPTGSSDDILLKDYLKPRRLVQEKLTWKERWAGKSIKIKINPYVAAGSLLAILAVGLIATPLVSKYLKDRKQ